MSFIGFPVDNEAIREFRDEIKKMNKTATRTNCIMIGLTVILVILTIVLVKLTWVLVYPK